MGLLQRGAWERAVDSKQTNKQTINKSPTHNCFARAKKMYWVKEVIFS